MMRSDLTPIERVVLDYCIDRLAENSTPTLLQIVESCKLSGPSRAKAIVDYLCDNKFLGKDDDGNITARERHKGKNITVTFIPGRDYWADRMEILEGMLCIERRVFDVDIRKYQYYLARLRFDEVTDFGARKGDALVLRKLKDWNAIKRFSRPRWALVHYRGNFGIRRFRVYRAGTKYAVELYRTRDHIEILDTHHVDFGDDFAIEGIIEGVQSQFLSVRPVGLETFLDETKAGPRKLGGKRVPPPKVDKTRLQEGVDSALYEEHAIAEALNSRRMDQPK